MEPSYGDQTQCPCCKECKDCNTGFQKVVDLKNVGLVIYRHITITEDVNQGSGIQFDKNTTPDVFILNNTKNMEITSADYMPEIEQNTINCPRCRKIIEHAQKLLQEVSIINRNDVKGICEHCRTKNKPCFICDEVVKKFVASKTKRAECTKERIKQWLFKIKRLLKNVVVDTKIGQEKVRAHSELYIDQLYRDVSKPQGETNIEGRDPDVEQMFQPKIHRSGFGVFEPSLANLVGTMDSPGQENNIVDRDNDNVSDVDRDNLKAMFYASLIEGEKQKKERHVTLIDHIPPVPFQSEESVVIVKETTKFDKILRPMSRYRQSRIEPDEKMKRFSEIYQSHDGRPEIMLVDKHKNKEKVFYGLDQRDPTKGLYTKIGESPYNIRKYHSEEAFPPTTATDTDNVIKQDFIYVFPRMLTRSPDINKLKRHKSSSELIKDTQDMLVARAENKKKILEEERKKKSEVKEKNSSKEEKKRHLEGKKETYEENNYFGVIERKDQQKEYETSILTDKKESFTRKDNVNVTPTSSKSEIYEGSFSLEKTKHRESGIIAESSKKYKEPNELKDIKELKGPKELRGLQDLKELKGPKELIGSKGPIGQKELKELSGPKELIGPKDPKDVRELRGPNELFGPKDPKNLKELKGPKELFGPKDLKDLKELRGSKELIGSKEPKGPRESKDLKEPKDSKQPKELKKSKSLKVLPEPKDSNLVKETKAQRDLKESKEPKISKETKDSKIPRKLKEPIGPKDTKESKISKVPKESIIDKDTFKAEKDQDKEEKETKRDKEEKDRLKKTKDEQVQVEKDFAKIGKDLQHKDKFQENFKDSKQREKEKPASNQYDREKKETDKKDKVGDKVQPESDKDFKTGAKSEPKNANEVTNIKSIKSMKVRKPSNDDLILKLVRLKQKNAGERRPDLNLSNKDAKGHKIYHKRNKTGACFMIMGPDNDVDDESIISIKNHPIADIIVGSKIFKRKLPKPIKQPLKAKQSKTHESDKNAREETKLDLINAADGKAEAISDPESPKDDIKEKKTNAKDLDIKSIKIRKPSHDDLILKLVKMKQAARGERKPKSNLKQTEINTKGNVYHKGNQTDLESDSDSDSDSESKDSHEIKSFIIGPKVFKQILKLPKPIGRKHKSKHVKNIEADNKSKEVKPKPKSVKNADVDATPEPDTPKVDIKGEQTTAKAIDFKLIQVRKPSHDNLILKLVKLKQASGGERKPKRLLNLEHTEKEIKTIGNVYHKTNQTGAADLDSDSDSDFDSESKDSHEIKSFIIGPKVFKQILKLPKPIGQKDKTKHVKNIEADKSKEANLKPKSVKNADVDATPEPQTPKVDIKGDQTTAKDIDFKLIQVRKPSQDDLISKLVKLKQASDGERKPKRLIDLEHTEKEINKIGNVYHKDNKTRAADLDLDSDSDFDSESKDSHEIKKVIIDPKIVKHVSKLPEPSDQKDKSKLVENIEAHNKTKEIKHKSVKNADVDATPEPQTPKVDIKGEKTTAKDIDFKLIQVRKPSHDDLISKLVKLKQASDGERKPKRLINVEHTEKEINTIGNVYHKANETRAAEVDLDSDSDFDSESKDSHEIKKVMIDPKIVKHVSKLPEPSNRKDKSKLVENIEAHNKTKEIKHKSVKNADVDATPEPQTPKVDIKGEKTTAKDIDFKLIQVRKPSPDDLILKLVKLKQASSTERKPKRLIDLEHTEKEIKTIGSVYHKDNETRAVDLDLDSESDFDSESKDSHEIKNIIIGPKIFKHILKLPEPIDRKDKSKLVENIEPDNKTKETKNKPKSVKNVDMDAAPEPEIPKVDIKIEQTTAKDIDFKLIQVRKPSLDDLILKLVKLKQTSSTERKPKRLIDLEHTEKEINTIGSVYHKDNETRAADLDLDSESDFDSESKDSHEIKNIIIGPKIFKHILKLPEPIDRKDKSKLVENTEADNETKEIKIKPKSVKSADVDAAPEPEIPKVDIQLEQTTAKDIDIELIKVRKPSPDDLILQLVRLKQSKSGQPGRRPENVLEFINKEAAIHRDSQTGACFMYLESNVKLGSESQDTLDKDKDEIANIIIGPNKTKYKIPPSDRQNDQNLPILFHSTFDVSDPVVKDDTISLIKETPVFTSVKQEDQEPPKGVIRYALSDRSFIDKGWTMLPTEKVVRKMNVYRMRPAQPQFDWFEHNKNKRVMEYDSGEKLAEFSDNGRGRWFYRNGRMALDYYDAEELNAQQRFVIYSSGEPDERGRAQPYTLLATFDYLGNGIVFDHSGKIRLKYNQTEGVVLDRSIGPVSNWKWHTLNDPPVLQQVMIDTQMAHKDPDILKLGGPREDISRPDNEDMLAIEFDNFVKEKSKKLSQTFKPFQIKMKALKINQQFSLRVLDQATVYLIFRDGTTNLKLNIGMVLDHKEIVDTDTAEVGEVSSSMERFPARTDSLAGLQKSIAHAQRYDRMRTERESRIRPTMPCRSVDKLVSAASRPMRPPLRVGPSSSATTVSEKYKCSRKPSSSNVYYDTRFC